MTCSDCGSSTVTMLGIRSPNGLWWLCSFCYRATLREAAIDRAAREAKVEQPVAKRKERVGSH